MQLYTEDFYKKQKKGSRQSAREVIPMILELLRPKSVIDIGCGVGTWLSVFIEFGVEDVFGIDGDHIDQKMLEIPRERFSPFDLSKPFRMDRQFDLVVSLEVAEHLPSECAEVFVDSLINLGPVILFSAAIPFQGGEHHVNEQWPDYWVEIFKEKGYVAIDCIRKNIWRNENVEWWYAQNILMFLRYNNLESYPLLKREFENATVSQLSVVHPRNYLNLIRLQLATRDISELIPCGDTFILVDQNQFGKEVAAGYHVIPFLERDGQYWGLPPDNKTAIQELERLRESGAKFIVFAWPAFWWLDYYLGFNEHLRANYRCVLENDRLIVFDLRK